MNVSMTPKLERSVMARVAAGRYRTAGEVVRATSRLLDKDEPFDGVRPTLDAGRNDNVATSR